MHHALEIQEILSNIFHHCYPHIMRGQACDLPALARTCRTFKEPALDTLWGELVDTSPLARCLPEAVRPMSLEKWEYAFIRPLTEVEWVTLRSYTHRIRTIQFFRFGLDWESVRAFLNPPTTQPLFPNLQHLDCGYVSKTMHLLHLPLPSLISLRFTFVDHLFEDFFRLFPKVAPQIKRLSITASSPRATFDDFISTYMFHWRDLRSVSCYGISLGLDALIHLSRMPELTELDFMLDTTLPDQIDLSGSPLIFSKVHILRLYSKSLTPISRFVSQTRFPVIKDLNVFAGTSPSKQEVSSFFACISHSIQELRLDHSRHGLDSENNWPLLEWEDLRPCTVFSDLRAIVIDIAWLVHLTADEVLALTSAWPHLEYFSINERTTAEDFR